MVTLKQKQNAEKKLKSLISKLQKRRTVEKVLQEVDVKGIYEKEKNAMMKSIKDFRKVMGPLIEEIEEPVTDNFEVTSDNAVEICLILMMSRIDDTELIASNARTSFYEILEYTCGKRQEISQRFFEFFCDGSGNFITDHTEEELLEMILL